MDYAQSVKGGPKMSPIPKFEYHTPVTLAGALELLHDLDEAKPIIGGTDLMLSMREAVCSPTHIVDLNRIPELNYIKEEEGLIKIGSTSTLAQVAVDPLTANIHALYDAVSRIGSPQIRNRGSITGNIVNASPAADTACPLIVHNAELVVQSVDYTNILPIEDLFVGPKINCLEPRELVTEIRIPKPPENSSSAYKRIGRRQAFTLSVVSAAVYLQVEDNLCLDAGVAFGSVDMTPLRVPDAEDLLKGKELIGENIMDVSEVVRDHVKPITDVRGTAEYRLDMCPILMRRALQTALERMR
jgi:carbon-monoxide dehydrogenase medium subunit